MKSWVAAVAIKTAWSSTYEKYRHGCVIEHGGTIIAKGVNSLRPYNPYPNSKYSVHAEESGLNRAGKRAIGATLYVSRIGKGGTLRNSQPCEKCMPRIRAAGIRAIYYSIGPQPNHWGMIKLY